MSYCPQCGREMQALLTTLFCPNECDRREGVACPKCLSLNTEAFDIGGILDCLAPDDVIRDSVTYHCWPCGEVWNIEGERPETD